MSFNNKMSETRKRAPNLSEKDKVLLGDLCLQYADIIENKKTDTCSSKIKEEAWKNLSAEFESVTMVHRDWRQLKHAYENMKQRAKKTAADEKVERKKTGGGAFTSKLNGTDEQILAVLGNRAKPLTNQFDSDALYHSEHGPVKTVMFYVDECGGIATNSGSIVNAPTEEFVIIDDTLLSPETEFTTVPSSDLPETESVTVPASTISDSKKCDVKPGSSDNQSLQKSKTWQRQWARPKPKRQATSVTAVNAATKIEELAAVKTSYYKRKMEMCEDMHRAEMELCELKKKLLTAKLQNEC